MRTGAIMDQKHMILGVIQDHLQEGLGTFRVQPALDALREQPPGEICNGSEDFVAFALATGWHFRLLASARPGRTQRAPLGKAGLISNRINPLVRLAARTIAGHFSSSQGRRLAVSRWSDAKRAFGNENPRLCSNVDT